MRTRTEHIAWCKERALKNVATDPMETFTSMMSDLTKHPETSNHSAIQLGMMLMMSGNLKSSAEVERFIRGFN